jgi:YaaC-like Protein
VLIYYGMVSLAKLILLMDRSQPLEIDQIEALERQGHGLRQLDRLNASESPLYSLDEAAVLVTAEVSHGRVYGARGVFPALCGRVCPHGGAGWLNASITIRELLRAVPQLDLMMRQIYGDVSGFSGVLVSDNMRLADGTCQFKLSDEGSNPKTVEDAQERIAYLDRRQYQVLIGPDGKLAIPADCDELYRLDAREELATDFYTLAPAWRGDRLDNLLAQYMLMYALSIVARYKPHRWAGIIEGRDTPLLPILEKLMSVSERWWPNLMLNFLVDKMICFAGPMYLG